MDSWWVGNLDQQQEQHRQHEKTKNPASAAAIESGALGMSDMPKP